MVFPPHEHLSSVHVQVLSGLLMLNCQDNLYRNHDTLFRNQSQFWTPYWNNKFFLSVWILTYKKRSEKWERNSNRLHKKHFNSEIFDRTVYSKKELSNGQLSFGLFQNFLLQKKCERLNWLSCYSSRLLNRSCIWTTFSFHVQRQFVFWFAFFCDGHFVSLMWEFNLSFLQRSF